MSQDTKYRASSQQGGNRVQTGHNQCIPVHIVAELVEGGVHNDVAEAHGQRVEALGHCCVPDFRIQDLAPLGPDEVVNAIDGPWESYGTYQKDTHDDVGEYGQEVRGLSGTFDAPTNDEKNTGPGQEQAKDQFPVGQTDSILDIGQLMQDFFAINR